MIKILHVVRGMDRGGAETMIMNFFRNINKEEYSFDFLVYVDKQCDYDAEICEFGGHIYRIREFKGYNLIAFERDCLEFFRIHNDYDIVHIHVGSCANSFIRAAKKFSIPTIAHSHNADFGLTIEGLLLRFLSRKTRYLADYFFACSQQAGIDRFSENITKSERFFIINNGIDSEKYRFNKLEYDLKREKLDIQEKIVYIHVGRFIPIKNHEFLIKVFYEIQKTQKNAILLLAGRGPCEENIKKQVDALGISDKVFFLGIRSDVNELLIASDCFVFPSRFEGLPIAFIEAQATGLAAIVTDVIPNEAFMTETSKALSINLSEKIWADECIKASTNYERVDTYNKIKEANFDIHSSLNYLCDLYQKIALPKGI